MQSLVKQLLTLTSATQKAQWEQVQQAIKPEELNTTQLAQVALHFAENQQGSEEFWKGLQEVSASKVDQFNREDLAILGKAMMVHPYEVQSYISEVDETVGEVISEGLTQFCQQELDKRTRQDPYYIVKEISEIQGQLGDHAFKAGPGFFQNATFDDEDSESDLESEDEDLTAFTTSEVRGGLFDFNETRPKQIEQTEFSANQSILDEIKKLFSGANNVVNNIKEIK